MTSGTESPEVRHEIDAEGRAAGVEAEEIGDGSEIKEPFDPRLIDVTTEVRTLDSLLKRLAVGQIDLDPDFQRSRGIWSDQKKSLLIESLLLRIPLPTFYVAETDGSDELGGTSWAVVDGIQRLSTIAEFVKPELLGLSPLHLKGLEYLKSEEGNNFESLPPSLQLRILESQFTIQVIRRTTPEPVKLNIFARINTGGVPLSRQELRHALIPGRARKLLKEMADSDSFQKAVAYSVSPSRMVDREMALRFIAFDLVDASEYSNSNFDEFLRDSMVSINSWDEGMIADVRRRFSISMEACEEIFGDDAFRKRYRIEDPRRPVSKALFEAVAVGVSGIYRDGGISALRSLTRQSGQIRQEFLELMRDREFDRSISQGTGDPRRIRVRFTKFRQLLDSLAE